MEITAFGDCQGQHIFGFICNLILCHVGFRPLVSLHQLVAKWWKRFDRFHHIIAYFCRYRQVMAHMNKSQICTCCMIFADSTQNLLPISRSCMSCSHGRPPPRMGKRSISNDGFDIFTRCIAKPPRDVRILGGKLCLFRAASPANRSAAPFSPQRARRGCCDTSHRIR